MPFTKRAVRDISYTTMPKLSFEALQSSIAAVSEDTLISKTVVPVYTKLKEEKPVQIPVITLTSKNVVVLRGPVTQESAHKLKMDILKLSNDLPDSAHIYLVLDTPGGSIGAGLSLIEVIHSIPQQVHSVTLFSASMGFQIVQSLENRYITSEGTLMSHRAKLGGVGGEVPGELIVRLNHFIRKLNRMDTVAAKRAGMKLEDYQDLIADEYWVDGEDAVKAQMADVVVAIRCSKRLIKQIDNVVVSGFLGTATLKFSKCPLLTDPMDVGYDFSTSNTKDKTKFKTFVESYYKNRTPYVKNYIKSGKYKLFIK